jgi:hypothetical protein
MARSVEDRHPNHAGIQGGTMRQEGNGFEETVRSGVNQYNGQTPTDGAYRERQPD